MRTIRIAAGAGYAGDRIEPALDNISRGNVDYIIFECLAERTIALAQQERFHNPEKGYNFLLDYRMEKVIPLLKDHPVKIITNMGAANPQAAARRMKEIAMANGLPDLKIISVTGDNVMALLDDFKDLTLMENGRPLSEIRENIVAANAYIGGRAITRALQMGADIVVTGRVADPSLVTGPLMYEFDKSYEDYDFLGKTIVAGHLLECASQVTGGYYADPGKKDVPNLWNLPFPILSFDEDGSITLEKLPGTGGLLNTHTVREQLLYEIKNPAEYLTPDVVADFSHLHVEDTDDGKVRVSGASGRQKTGTLKVTVVHKDGYIADAQISYGGRNCVARAKLADEILKKRCDLIGLKYDEIRTDLIGLTSLYGTSPDTESESLIHEVRLRVAAHTKEEPEAKGVCREMESLYVNGPYGGGGVRYSVKEVMAAVSVLIPEEKVKPVLTNEKGEVL